MPEGVDDSGVGAPQEHDHALTGVEEERLVVERGIGPGQASTPGQRLRSAVGSAFAAGLPRANRFHWGRDA